MGTSPIERPSRRAGASSARRSATVRRVFRARLPRGRGQGATGAAVGGEAAGRVGEGVEEGEILRRALGDRLALALDGPLVAARDRAGQRLGGTGRRPVLHARAHELGEWLAADPRGGGEALRDAFERDEEVRGDAGGGVVGGAVLVGDVHGAHPERVRELASCGQRARGRAGDRGGGPGEARAALGHGHQRVQAERLAVSGERGERRRGGAVADEQPRPSRDGRRGVRDLGVGDAEQHGVHAGRQRRVAAEGPVDPQAGAAERRGERGSEAPGADDRGAAHERRPSSQLGVRVGVHVGPVLGRYRSRCMGAVAALATNTREP